MAIFFILRIAVPHFIIAILADSQPFNNTACSHIWLMYFDTFSGSGIRKPAGIHGKTKSCQCTGKDAFMKMLLIAGT
jgi:hypothetical protein